MYKRREGKEDLLALNDLYKELLVRYQSIGRKIDRLRVYLDFQGDIGRMDNFFNNYFPRFLKGSLANPGDKRWIVNIGLDALSEIENLIIKYRDLRVFVNEEELKF